MRRRTTGAALAAVSLVLTVLVTGPGAASSSADAGPTYTNPVSKTFADTFADPSVIRGKDGWWYSYGTSDPLREGEGTPHRIPIARSRNLVDWTYVGDAFTAANRPTWADPRCRHLGTGHPLRRRRVPHVLRRHRDDGDRQGRRQRDRDGDRPHPGGSVDRQRGAGRRPARAATAASCGRSTRRWSATGTGRSGSSTARTTAASSSRRSTTSGRKVIGADKRSRSTTSSRARTSCAVTASGTCSPRPPTAAPGRPPATACRSAGPATCAAPTSTSRACRWSRRGPAAPRCSTRTATAGSAPATTRSSPTSLVRTGSSTTRSTAPTPTWTARPASTSGRCCWTGSTGSTGGRCVRADRGPSEQAQPAPVTATRPSLDRSRGGALDPARRGAAPVRGRG